MTFKFYKVINTLEWLLSFNIVFPSCYFEIVSFVSLTEKVTKYCEEDGLWYTHPDSNISWSNYTMCNAFTPEKMQVGSISNFSIG